MSSNIKLSTNKKSQDTIFVILIAFMFVDWDTYGYFIFYMPFIYMLFKYGISKYCDTNFWLLLFFGILYSFIDYLNTGNINYVNNIQPIINFPILYLFGRILSKRNNIDFIVPVILLFSMSLALLTILSISQSILQDGFSVVYRDIKLVGSSNKNILMSATGLYARILPLSLFISFLFYKCNKKIKVLAIGLSLISLVCCLRLQSRSSMYILALVLIVTLLLYDNSRILNKIFGIAIIFGIVIFVLKNFASELYILQRFEENGAFENSNAEGRSELSKMVLQNLVINPFGGMDNNIYAHNLWLDIGRKSGLLPLILMIWITIRWAKATIAVYKNKCLIPYFKTFIVVVTISLFAYFNVEPIIEGAPMLFGFFCVFWGIISMYYKLDSDFR